MAMLLAMLLLGGSAAARASAPAAAAGRTTVPFQYAWRFHYGDDPSSPPESGPGTAVFETDLANYSVLPPPTPGHPKSTCRPLLMCMGLSRC